MTDQEVMSLTLFALILIPVALLHRKLTLPCWLNVALLVIWPLLFGFFLRGLHRGW